MYFEGREELSFVGSVEVGASIVVLKNLRSKVRKLIKEECF